MSSLSPSIFAVSVVAFCVAAALSDGEQVPLSIGPQSPTTTQVVPVLWTVVGGSGKGGLENFFTAATAITAPYFCVSLLGPRPGGRGRVAVSPLLYR